MRAPRVASPGVLPRPSCSLPRPGRPAPPFPLGGTCVSPVRPDGSLVHSGFLLGNGQSRYTLVRHRGGVPGTDVTPVPRHRARAAGRRAVLHSGAGVEQPRPDGGIAGFPSDAAGVRSAAYWIAADEPTVVPVAAGEQNAAGVAAAGGGRMVIPAQQADGTSRLGR